MAPLKPSDRAETNISFCSIASLSPFRKNLPPRSPQSTKPYEVFPGIWNTDATAKVFGYLDSTKPPLSKSTEQIPMQRQNSNHRTYLQSPALARRLLDRYREVHNDDGTDDFSRRAHRQHVEAWDRRRQERRDEAKREREASRRSAMRARMRTVSRDDELIQRGANPRTGVVSPELVTDASRESVEDDQIAVRHRKESGRKKREGSSKWKQNDLGWSLVESPSFSPSAESKEPGRAVLADKLQDQFVVVMPGVDNPAPAEMTPTQIQDYQERFRDIYSYGRADPTEVGLRQWMPEPRNRVHNIPRKEVGSGHAQRNGSTDTVIIQDQLRAPSLSTPRKDIMRDRRVRIVTPLPTSASNPPVVDRDSYSEKVPSQTTDSINQMSYPKIHCRINHLPEAKAPGTSTPTSLAPRKYIPRLDFLHPSQFSSPTTSYRRPKELQPARLRAVKTIEKTNRRQDASPNVISGQGLRIEEGSKMQLQNCAAEFPRASFPNLGQERRCQNVAHGTQPAITSFLPTTPKASKTALKVHNVKVHNNRIVPDALGTEVEDGTTMVKNDEGAVKQLEKHSAAAASCSCTRCNSLPSHAAIELMTSKQGLSPKSANMAQTPRQNKARYVQVNESTERTSEGICGAKRRSTTRTRTQSAKKPPGQISEGPPELDITGSERLVDYRARGVDDDKHDEQNKKSGVDGLVHEASTLGIVVGLWRLIGLVEQKFYDSIRMRSIQRRLTEMIHHMLLTLHTSSPALEVLRMPNATMEEYLAALKDVIRAIFYLLVLLNIVMVLGKFLRLAALAIHLLWLPLKMVLLVVRWFISG